MRLLSPRRGSLVGVQHHFDAGRAAAVVSGADLNAAEASRTEVITVRADQDLEDAARLMVENRVEHLLVINPASGHAEGILSALDIAAAFGRRP